MTLLTKNKKSLIRLYIFTIILCILTCVLISKMLHNKKKLITIHNINDYVATKPEPYPVSLYFSYFNDFEILNSSTGCNIYYDNYGKNPYPYMSRMW